MADEDQPVPAPVPPADPTPASDADSGKPQPTDAKADPKLPDPSKGAVRCALVFIVLAILTALGLDLSNADQDPPFDPAKVTGADLALFAGFFLAASAIERVLELVAPALPWWDYPGKTLARTIEAQGARELTRLAGAGSPAGTSPDAETKAAQAGTSPDAETKAAQAGTSPDAETKAAQAGTSPDAETKAAQAAFVEKTINQKKADRGYAILGLAAWFGVIASGAAGLYLLEAVGMDTSRWLDMLITGVAVSGGTKGIHELIKTLQKVKGPTTAG